MASVEVIMDVDEWEEAVVEELKDIKAGIANVKEEEQEDGEYEEEDAHFDLRVLGPDEDGWVTLGWYDQERAESVLKELRGNNENFSLGGFELNPALA